MRPFPPDLLALLDEVQALPGVASGRRPVAEQLLEDRHRLDDRGQQPDLAAGHEAAVLRLVEGEGLAQAGRRGRGTARRAPGRTWR